MKQRTAAKVLGRAIEGSHYRASTVGRAVARMRGRRTISRGRFSAKDSAAMTVAFMQHLGSIHAVRFWHESQQAFRELESFRERSN